MESWSRLILGLGVSMVYIVSAGASDPMIPRIEGDWWIVTGNPDLGSYTTEKQQPVDFGMWKAIDGTWQLWSCIRHTSCGGNTRLFYRWQGERITDQNWKPMGIAMQADPHLGETPGGLQAPYVLRVNSIYKMFYGDWEHVCLALSMDGKTFARRLLPNGKPGMFTEGPGSNTRDPMVIKIGYQYYCYYTAHPNRNGAVYCRTSFDLQHWSDSHIVAYGGQAGTKFYSAECPHVIERKGFFYLFRTQRYGKNARTSVYRSKNPLDFGVDDDRYFLCHLPVAAPEIVVDQGREYIAALRPKLNGIQIAKLGWTKK